MKKKMYRILALICVCAMMVCSFSLAADVTPSDVAPAAVNSVSYGTSCGRSSSSGYTNSSTVGMIGVSIDGEVITESYKTVNVDSSASNIGNSVSCYDSYGENAISGWVDGEHWYEGETYWSYDIL